MKHNVFIMWQSSNFKPQDQGIFMLHVYLYIRVSREIFWLGSPISSVSKRFNHQISKRNPYISLASFTF